MAVVLAAISLSGRVKSLNPFKEFLLVEPYESIDLEISRDLIFILIDPLRRYVQHPGHLVNREYQPHEIHLSQDLYPDLSSTPKLSRQPTWLCAYPDNAHYFFYLYIKPNLTKQGGSKMDDWKDQMLDWIEQDIERTIKLMQHFMGVLSYEIDYLEELLQLKEDIDNGLLP